MDIVALIFKILNLVLSAATASYATYAASGSIEGATVAGMASAVQHMRENPVSGEALAKITTVTP
jgi:hypothetical protein